MYFNIPEYDRDKVVTPMRDWEQVDEDEYTCTAGRASLRVFRFGEGKPWWAECDNPEFEAKAWFWTPEQAQFWAEEQLDNWSN